MYCAELCIGKFQYASRRGMYFAKIEYRAQEPEWFDYSYYKHNNEKDNENNDQNCYAAT